jgi:phosphonate transport system substrate-binding protein
MNLYKINAKILIVIIFLLVFQPFSMLFADDALIMGVFPRRNAQISYQMYSPLANYLSKQLGREVKLSLSKNFATFWQGVKNRKYDLVHYNQLHYLRSHKNFSYNVILQNEEFGKSTLAGAILVHKNSGINSLEALKGKRIIFGGGPGAMISSVVTRLLLLEHGLSTNDYQTMYAINPPNAAVSVFTGDADAAGTGDGVLNLKVVNNAIDTTQLTILAKSDALAHLPWAVKSDMSIAVQKQIKSLLLNLIKTPAGKNILKSAGLTNFRVAENTDYDPHRVIVKKVLGKSY